MSDPTVSTHNVWFCEPCDCDSPDDHDRGQEVTEHE
jgi:hypothetical protein